MGSRVLLLAHLVHGLHVSLQILSAIGPVLDLALFQKAIQFVACFKPQDQPQLMGGDAVIAIRLNRSIFQQGTRRLLAGGIICAANSSGMSTVMRISKG